LLVLNEQSGTCCPREHWTESEFSLSRNIALKWIIMINRYSRILLKRLWLWRQPAYNDASSLVPAEIISLTCIRVRLYHHFANSNAFCGTPLKILFVYSRVPKRTCPRATQAITQQTEGRTSCGTWLLQRGFIPSNQQILRKCILFHYWQNIFAGRSYGTPGATVACFITVWSVSSAIWSHYTNLLWPNVMRTQF